MKTVLVVGVLCMLVAVITASNDSNEDQENNWQKLLDHCEDFSNASDADVMTAMQHRNPETHEGKCMLFCIWRELGIIRLKADGTYELDEARLLKTAVQRRVDAQSTSKLKKIFKTCNKTVTDSKYPDRCEYTAVAAKCLQKEKENEKLNTRAL